MTNVYELFKDLIWVPEDFTECLWYTTGDEVYWNTENNIDDLMTGDGETFSSEVYEETQRDGYVFYTCRDGCGGMDQSIFKLSNKVDDNKYWDEQE